MVYFKACPRCRGDMTPGEDMYGRYLECLQCGYQAEVQEAARRVKPPPRGKERVPAGVA